MFPGQPPLGAAAMAGPAWKKVTFPFALTRAYNKGEGELYFTLGHQAQTVELGGIELVNYGSTRKVADLPFTKLGYQASEATAAWRRAAEARIDKVRKGDLTIVVKDASGRYVANAEVAIHMRRHAFLWGTAVSGMAFTGGRMPPENLARYKEEIKKNFTLRRPGKREQMAAMGQRSLSPRHARHHRVAARKRPTGPRPQPCLAFLAQHQRQGRHGRPRQSRSARQSHHRSHSRNHRRLPRSHDRLGRHQRNLHQS
jgi:hypothetical protein